SGRPRFPDRHRLLGEGREGPRWSTRGGGLRRRQTDARSRAAGPRCCTAFPGRRVGMSTAPFHALLPLSRKSTGAILDKLTEDLADPAGLGNSHRRIDNFPDAYMAAVVERIGADRYSVAHYFEQNGD